MSSVRRIAVGAAGVLGAIGVSAGIASLIMQLREAVALAERQINAEQRVAAVVKSTGKAAGFTARELQKQAAALQKVTTFGDEEILELQAIILTFRNITQDTFKQTTEAALDLATVLGTDAKSGALQLGKALEDPIRGVTALTRSGVSFNEQQKEQIRNLVESNQLLEAQKIVMEGIQIQVGGVAREMAKTDVGKIKQMKNALADVKEEIGRRLIPVQLEFMETARLVWDNFAAIAEIAYINVLQAAMDVFPQLEWVMQETGAVFVATWEAAKSFFLTFVEIVKGGLEEIGNFATAVGEGVHAAYDALATGGVRESVTAFRDAFVKTLAEQEDVPLPTADFAKVFAETRKAILDEFERGGGVGDRLKARRRELENQIMENELERAKAIEDAKKVVAVAAGGRGGGGGKIPTPTEPESLGVRFRFADFGRQIQDAILRKEDPVVKATKDAQKSNDELLKQIDTNLTRINGLGLV
jgi:hypothetical protein